MGKIMVTGSQGYIGSRLVPQLIKSGHETIGVDTGYFTDRPLMTPEVYQSISKDVRFLDMSDLKGIDTLVFLAGMMNETVGYLTPEKIYNPIRDNTIRVARLCKDLGIRFIFASSCSVYGIGQESMLDEESSVNPQTPYAVNKYEIESELQTLSGEGFSPIALRLSTVFGVSPSMRFDMLINMLAGMALTSGQIVLNSDGSSWRPHIYITDVCQAFRRCVDLDYTGNELLILNTGQDQNNIQTLEIARIVQNLIPGTMLEYLSNMKLITGKDRELISGSTAPESVQDGKDTRTYDVSFEKIHRTLPGFSCEYSVRDGIKGLLESLRAIKLTEKSFKHTNYYRLKKMNELHAHKRIDDELFWVCE